MLSDLANKSTKKLLVEPPAMVELGLYSVAFMMSLTFHNTLMQKRIWINRVDSEIVFHAIHLLLKMSTMKRCGWLL